MMTSALQEPPKKPRSKNLPDFFDTSQAFLERHVGPSSEEITEMLQCMGLDTLDQLINAVVPKEIRLSKPLALPAAASEEQALRELKSLLSENQLFRSYLGMGYAGTFTPSVLQRNIVENPGWYTAYTPYQAEIAQGRLEALLHFQTMVTELTGMEVANASLLDEATAAAEAMLLAFHQRPQEETRGFFVSQGCHPQTLAVLQTRAQPLGIEIEVGDPQELAWNKRFFALLLQYPNTDGRLEDNEALVNEVHATGGRVIVATDLLALCWLKPPGEWGADLVVGNTQRFGVPLGFGGPHAAFFATREKDKRRIPGRIVGISYDAHGNPAYRLALQTREQHIRREKATSNICTAQVLLAVLAGMYAVYHGPQGLRRIAKRVHFLTVTLAQGLRRLGGHIHHSLFFDTLQISQEGKTSQELAQMAQKHRVNLRVLDEKSVGITLDETVDFEDLDLLFRIFHGGTSPDFTAHKLAAEATCPLPESFLRHSQPLQHPVFHSYHTETEMLRYLRRLESRDLSLTTSMIPLGSCTMKLNATTEMLPLSWPEVSGLHPFIPAEQAQGYHRLFEQLEKWLGEITGLPFVSLQPNAGSQGEYAGLLAIQGFHQSRGEKHRNVCLIPLSAHGTNPASAALAGLKVVPIRCDEKGNIDLQDLQKKATEHQETLASIMITYPSTHGVFEENILEVIKLVHRYGGQVYLDGANLNAQVGLCRPGDFGVDVCHMNLHKTFCIPHGGGGPGVGPIAVASHLAPFLPGHFQLPPEKGQGGSVCAAPWGSASILVISWLYLRLLGAQGLTHATKVAILNANYLAHQLHSFFPVLYRGCKGWVAHECILDFRASKKEAGIEVEDVAKRLMDYGFHAPTMSWPVPGTLMVEPTESETKAEIDRFSDSLQSIHAEIEAIANQAAHPQHNVLKQAPHTAEAVISNQWDRPYSREEAAYPAPWTRQHKFWPPVGRIDNVYGDRNLICSCLPMNLEKAS